MNYKDKICEECGERPAHCGDPKRLCILCANEFLHGYYTEEGCMPLFPGNSSYTLPDPNPSQENAIRALEDG